MKNALGLHPSSEGTHAVPKTTGKKVWRIDQLTLVRLANKYKLSHLQGKKYILVMRARFPDEGDVAYADQWAERFSKDPYIYADKKTTKELNKVMTLSDTQLDARLRKL